MGLGTLFGWGLNGNPPEAHVKQGVLIPTLTHAQLEVEALVVCVEEVYQCIKAQSKGKQRKHYFLRKSLLHTLKTICIRFPGTRRRLGLSRFIEVFPRLLGFVSDSNREHATMFSWGWLTLAAKSAPGMALLLNPRLVGAGMAERVAKGPTCA